MHGQINKITAVPEHSEQSLKALLELPTIKSATEKAMPIIAAFESIATVCSVNGKGLNL